MNISTPNTRNGKGRAMAIADQTELATTNWSGSELEHLRELIQAEETSAWDIGDTLLRLLPIGRVGVKTGVAAKIRELAAEVDAEPKTLDLYRTVANGWPEPTRVGAATWAAHRAYMGPASTAHERARTLLSLPRNEHGKITVQAVKRLTKAGSSGKPGWHELIGRVGDSLTKAEHQRRQFVKAIGDKRPNAKLRDKAARYADQAEALAAELRAIAEP
jgi:hypothetical protein